MASQALKQDFLEIPKTALVISLSLHGAFLLFFSTMTILEHYGISWKKPSEEKRVTQEFIQVDVVALPDQMISDRIDTALPSVDHKPIVLPADEDDDIIAEERKPIDKKAKEKAEKAEKEKNLAKMQAEQDAALKKLQAEADREKALKSLSVPNEKATRAKLKGNRVSEGTGTSGLIGTTKDRYAALVKKAIEENFGLYPWQKKKGLVAVVYLEIASSGRVKNKKMITSSTDNVFNSSVMQAIQRSQPLPIPEDLNLLSDGITIEFRPKE